jgi:DNA replicative helicase MCM subunit Mcm2 (Cdc46/Mcm family)
MALAKKPNIAQILFDSVAPSIWGHSHVKTGIALAMFGGQAKARALCAAPLPRSPHP